MTTTIGANDIDLQGEQICASPIRIWLKKEFGEMGLASVNSKWGRGGDRCV
jgi:hypothetical protein